MRKILLGFLFLLFVSPAFADIKTEMIEYKQGDTVLEGILAYDDSIKGKQPGILVVHNWLGITGQTERRIKMLAELGYVAFAADIYGKGIRPKDSGEAGQQATLYKSDRALLRERALAGLDVLKKNAMVDENKLAAIGYCFGGTTALEIARSGSDVAGVVSFHGGLNSPTPEDAKNIKAKILVLHGADDPYVPAEEIADFQKEMTDAKADWQMIYYSNAVHSFTEKEAGNDNSKGAAYNEKADARSWEAMKQFFGEIF